MNPPTDADKWLSEWLKRKRIGGVKHMWRDHFVEALEAYAAERNAEAVEQARESEREACCRDICGMCEAGEPIEFVDGHWIHKFRPHYKRGTRCRAEAIRNRASAPPLPSEAARLTQLIDDELALIVGHANIEFDPVEVLQRLRAAIASAPPRGEE